MKETEIIQRFNALESARSTLDSTLECIEKYVVPFRGNFFNPTAGEGEVEWRRRQIYDSTAVSAAVLLASQIHGDLTSPAVKWFSLRFRDEALNKNQEAKEWLEACEEREWQALCESDFNLEVAEGYLDLVSLATAIIFEEQIDPDEWEGLDFSALPMNDCFFEQNAKGGVGRLYRRLQYTKLQMIDHFGEDKLPKVVADYKGDDPGKAWTVIFCIYPRPEQKDADTTRMLAPKARPFGYKYVLKDDSVLIDEGGYYEMPAFACRWQKVSGSQWGFSPAFVALSDIIQLNYVVAQLSEARAKAIDPAMKARENGVIGDVELQAGGVTVVRNVEDLQPIINGTRWDQADAEIERLQQSIRSIFHIDKLELKDSPAMTATEVQVRYERMQRMLGPTAGRLQTDFLAPMIERTFMILLRAGQFPEQPSAVVGAELDIEYVGPLPRAQKSETAFGIEQFLASLAAMAEVFPEALDLPDIDDLIRTLAELRGVPASGLKGVDELQAMREERRQAQQQAMQLAQAQAGGEALQSVGKGVKAIEGEAA